MQFYMVDRNRKYMYSELSVEKHRLKGWKLNSIFSSN